MALRKLKYHEQKLLKKVDFLQWKSDKSLRENSILRRYHIQRREDYTAYNKLTGCIKRLVHKLKALPNDDAFRVDITRQLLQKLFNLGLIATEGNLIEADKITASSFCRRRLPVVMARLKMAQTLREAVTFVEQGHVRVGVETVVDPALLVTRSMEDHVTWVDSSKIKRHLLNYHDKRDDYALLES